METNKEYFKRIKYEIERAGLHLLDIGKALGINSYSAIRYRIVNKAFRVTDIEKLCQKFNLDKEIFFTKNKNA